MGNSTLDLSLCLTCAGRLAACVRRETNDVQIKKRETLFDAPTRSEVQVFPPFGQN